MQLIFFKTSEKSSIIFLNYLTSISLTVSHFSGLFCSFFFYVLNGCLQFSTYLIRCINPKHKFDQNRAKRPLGSTSFFFWLQTTVVTCRCSTSQAGRISDVTAWTLFLRSVWLGIWCKLLRLVPVKFVILGSADWIGFWWFLFG